MFRSGLVWSFGNNFISTSVVIFLAISHGLNWSGPYLGMLIAAPFLAGVLRSFAPVMIRRVGSVRKFCITAYLTEIVFLWLMLVLGRPDYLSNRAALACITVFWCLANLAEHCGTVAFFAWNGEIFPEKTRGRFFGMRERWRMAGEMISLAICVAVMYVWENDAFLRESVPKYYVFALLAAVGTVFIAAGTLLLGKVHDGKCFKAEKSGATAETLTFRGVFRELLEPLSDRRFQPLLIYAAYFSFITQLEQAFQLTYPAKLFGEKTLFFGAGAAFVAVQTLRFLIRGGQVILAPATGAWIDRRGVVPVLVFSQFVTAFGPLFYFFAAPPYGWVIFGSALCYMAYVGLNVGLPQVQLQAAPPGKGATWLACYGAVGGVFAFTGALLGGAIYQDFPYVDFTQRVCGGCPVLRTVFWVQLPFLISFVLRLGAVPLLQKIDN